MSEPTPPQPSHPPPGQPLIDFGPIALFVISFFLLQRIPAYKDNAVFIATGVFIAATLAAIIYCRVTRGRVPPVLIVTGIIITTFGGLTIALHSDTFLKIKNTIENLFFATAIAGSLLMRQNALKLVFGHVYNMPERAWTIFAWRWAGLFAALAGVNEIMRSTLTTAGWITWHFPVLFGLTLLFAAANVPFILKHHVEAPAA